MSRNVPFRYEAEKGTILATEKNKTGANCRGSRGMRGVDRTRSKLCQIANVCATLKPWSVSCGSPCGTEAERWASITQGAKAKGAAQPKTNEAYERRRQASHKEGVGEGNG